MSKRAAIILIATFLLCACKQRQHLSRANIAVVERQFLQSQEQMQRGVRDAAVTVKEVESVLGPPHRVDPPESARRDVEVFRYYYQQDSDVYELHFFDGRLIQIAKLSSMPSAKSESKP